jgi:hypothetical protein
MNVQSRSVCLVVVGMAVVGLAACGGGSKKTTKSATPTPTPSTSTATPTPTPTPTPAAAAVNPFTGGPPSANGVVAVKIDDTGNGRPQVNIDKANVVYIEQVEGGLTRLLAVFDSALPTVEAVRSTRASDPELMAQYGPVAYVASGGAPNPLQVLDASNLKSDINDRSGPGFARDPDRPVPYNLTANLAEIASALKPPRAKSIGFTFARATPNLLALPVYSQINTVVGATSVGFVYDKVTNRYDRVIGGVVQRTAAGTTISTPNVIVQFCSVTVYPQDIDVNGNPSKYTHTVGTGKVVIYRDGRRLVGTWSRPNAASGTTFSGANGKPLSLELGGEWVVLVANGSPLTS